MYQGKTINPRAKRNAQRGEQIMHEEENKPVIIGRNDGCLICEDVGYICDDCLFDYFDEENI